MAHSRPPDRAASHRDIADRRGCLDEGEQHLRHSLPRALPILDGELKLLDQLLGAEIARLLEEEN